jgi:hypothetical protein
MISSVVSIFLFLYDSLRSEMSLSVVSTPKSSLMSVSSSFSRSSSSIFLPKVKTEDREELILSRVLASLSVKKRVVLVKIPIKASS